MPAIVIETRVHSGRDSASPSFDDELQRALFHLPEFACTYNVHALLFQPQCVLGVCKAADVPAVTAARQAQPPTKPATGILGSRTHLDSFSAESAADSGPSLSQLSRYPALEANDVRRQLQPRNAHCQKEKGLDNCLAYS